jgi:dimethylargininase
MFRHAIVCPPGPNLVAGLSQAGLGLPDPALAATQHAAYVGELRALGLDVEVLAVDPDHPDSTFVEDTAIVTPRGALLTRPGADSRRGEVARMAPALSRHFPTLARIEPPGTLDGGDVCDADGHFLIGLTERTNQAGAEQLAAWLGTLGYTAALVDVRSLPGLLHLKTGLSYLGDGLFLLAPELDGHPSLSRAWPPADGHTGPRPPREPLVVPAAERYAANSLRIDGPRGSRVLVPAGHPQTSALLRASGLAVRELEMSELERVDGGLSCLSLRF